MWPQWIVVEWTLAGLASIVFWLIVASMLADRFRGHRAHRAGRSRHGGHRPTPAP